MKTVGEVTGPRADFSLTDARSCNGRCGGFVPEFRVIGKAMALRLGVSVALAILLAGHPNAARSSALHPTVLDHSASIRGDNALIAEVEVSLSRPSRVFVEYENPQAGKFLTALSESGVKHSIPVVRLRAQTTYSYAIGVQDADGAARLGPRGKFTTGPLPAELAKTHTRASGRSSQPLILIHHGIALHRPANVFGYILFRDAAGDIVWYYAHRPGKDFFLEPYFMELTIKQKSNGNLIYLTHNCCLTEITPLGEVVHRLPASEEAGVPHHDFVLLDDGRILYLSYLKTVFDDSANGGAVETSAFADALRIWDPEGGRVEQVWDSRDFWDIASAEQRDLWAHHRHMLEGRSFCWMHINSISFGPRGNIILSSRQRQQVISITADLKTIEWQLSGPDSDYSFPNPNDRFYAQHQATELPNGNILLFDNGRKRPKSEGGEYSRALEIRLDDERRSAVKVWEYRAKPDIYSAFVSGAARLSNGNTLINFGQRKNSDLEPLTLIEVDPQGNELFRVEILQLDRHPEIHPFRFRAAGEVDSIMGETMLRTPTASTPAGTFNPDDRQYWKAVQQQHREHRLNQYRQLYESLVSGDLEASLVRSTFDVHLSGRTLTYFKRSCDADDTQAKFLLHVFPVDEGDLLLDRRRFGFSDLDFHFAWSGEFINGGCVAQRLLPDYPIGRIRTGQYGSGEEPQWKVEFPMERAGPLPP